jgi:hypothetical protein
VKPEPKGFKVKPEPKVFKVNLEEHGEQGIQQVNLEEMVQWNSMVNLEEMEQMEYQDLVLQLIGRTAR